MSTDSTASSSRTRLLVAGLIGAGAGLALVYAAKQQSRLKEKEPAKQEPAKESKESGGCCGGSGGDGCCKETDSTPKPQEPTKAAAPDLEATPEANQQSSGGGGCGRNQGPMAAWQDKIHKSHMAVGDTLLALRGRANMRTVASELRTLQQLLGTAESAVHDSSYCTGREDKLNELAEALTPLVSSDASSQLLHPTTGEALRQDLIDKLESWDD